MINMFLVCPTEQKPKTQRNQHGINSQVEMEWDTTGAAINGNNTRVTTKTWSNYTDIIHICKAGNERKTLSALLYNPSNICILPSVHLTLSMLRLLSSKAQWCKDFWKSSKTLSCWYSLDSSHWAFPDEYQCAMVSVIF